MRKTGTRWCRVRVCTKLYTKGLRSVSEYRRSLHEPRPCTCRVHSGDSTEVTLLSSPQKCPWKAKAGRKPNKYFRERNYKSILVQSTEWSPRSRARLIIWYFRKVNRQTCECLGSVPPWQKYMQCSIQVCLVRWVVLIKPVHYHHIMGDTCSGPPATVSSKAAVTNDQW